MKSTDLANWTYLGDLLHEDYPANLGVAKGEDISCANMFKIGDAVVESVRAWRIRTIYRGPAERE